MFMTLAFAGLVISCSPAAGCADDDRHVFMSVRDSVTGQHVNVVVPEDKAMQAAAYFLSGADSELHPQYAAANYVQELLDSVAGEAGLDSDNFRIIP